MKNFHGLTRQLLIAWVFVYLILMLPSFCKGLFFYILSDFTMPASHYLDIIYTATRGLRWLVPTLFLLLAYYLSRPYKSQY